MTAFFYDSTGSNTAPYDTWAKAATSLVTVAAAMAAGDTLWFGDDSNESNATNQTVTFPGTVTSPNFIYVVDHTVASPGTGDLKTGAAGAGSFTTTTSGSITFNGNFYMYGAYISCGSGSNNPSIGITNNDPNYQIYENCKLVLGGTLGGQIRALNPDGAVFLKNCSVKFASSSCVMAFRAKGSWIIGSVDGTGSVPTTLFSPAGGTANQIYVEAVDLSAINTTLVAATLATNLTALFNECKINASVILASAQTGGEGGQTIDMIRCDSGAATYRTERATESGTLVTSSSVIRTGGASDGTTGYSWKIATTARARWTTPFKTQPLAIWNSGTAATVAVTLEGIADPRDFSALPNNDDVWFNLECLQTSGNPLGVFTSGTKANNLATGGALTASTKAWDSQATAWAALTTYSAGNIIKSVNNPGRLFLCTTGGTTGASEAAGFATAVDGGTVVDATATFKAMWRFSQTVTSGTIQLAGPITAYVQVGKASLNGIYVDPVQTINGVTVQRTFSMAPGTFLSEPISGGGGHIIGG